MKSIWRILLCCATACFMQYQPARAGDSIRYIGPTPLLVSLNKTTNLLFHYKIKQVDIGSGDIIAQLCNDTVLLVKAARADFPLSNLSVYTADGRLHAFSVGYSAAPEHLYLQIGENQANIAQTDLSLAMPLAQTDNVMEEYSKRALSQGYGRARLRDQQGLVSLSLSHPYTHADLLFFPIKIGNRSALSYETQQLRCYIRDKRRIKRMATQEREVKPLYIWGEARYIPGQSSREIVVVLPRLTLADGKFLRIGLTEKEGGRNLSIDVSNRMLVRSKRI